MSLKKTFHALLTLSALLILPGCATPSASASEPTSAYLFVHFIGESEQGEQIYFSTSEDGFHWEDLNDSTPVLYSTLGEKGVRDPSIIRSHDGKKFYILATDLRIASGKGWDDARFGKKTSLVIWESTDLVNWSEPWLADVAGAIPESGCAWAPEAIYDDSTGDYFVYWTTISPRDGLMAARIYGAHTKDFRTFTPPELYIERPGKALGRGDIIDTQIIEVKGMKHRFYRVSRDGQITLEGGDTLTGADWERIGDISYLGYTARQVEGPILCQFNQEQKWGLFVDQYGSDGGYLPLFSTNLDDPRGFDVPAREAYDFGVSKKRHGSILKITRSEFEALRAKWPCHPVVSISPLSQPEQSLRHSRFRLRLDEDVTPVNDGRWVLVAGLDGGRDTISFRSVDFPDRYLHAAANGVDVLPSDGTPAFAAQVSFVRVPGLASAEGVSLRLSASPERYLKADSTGVTVGPVSSSADRQSATFDLRDAVGQE